MKQLVIQHLVTVTQRREKHVLAQLGRLRQVLLIRTHRLLLQREHRPRKQTVKPKRRALLDRERGPSVVARISQQISTARQKRGGDSGHLLLPSRYVSSIGLVVASTNTDVAHTNRQRTPTTCAQPLSRSTMRAAPANTQTAASR